MITPAMIKWVCKTAPAVEDIRKLLQIPLHFSSGSAKLPL